MDYYFCSAEELRHEIRRRGYAAVGGQDELSEELRQDDERRGTDATTVKTLDSQFFSPRAKLRIAHSPNVVHPGLLVGEKITHWTLDTFFPTLQLFFESGLSCTFEGGYRQSAKVGLDPNLRFRLTDLTHEESGFVSSSTLPQKFRRPAMSIKVVEAAIAERTSIAVQSMAPTCANGRPPSRPQGIMQTETHIVVGLRLEGMEKMGFVWARNDSGAHYRSATWHDVSVVGLRDDVPAPFIGFPQKHARMGSRVGVVTKESMINGFHKTNGDGTNGWG
jgi:hypothetical protein